MVVATAGYCEEPSKPAQETLLKVDAVILKDVEGVDPLFGKTFFSVMAKVQNISKENITLSAWSCSYAEDWVTDNKSIFPRQLNCKNNVLYAIALKPGETREFTLAMSRPSNVLLKDIRFKLGYKAKRPIGEFKRTPIAGEPFWSDDVILHIKPVPERQQKQ